MGELISVVLPIYNVEKYLEKCIRSVINQTYKNIEIILVDDGSSDQSGKICDTYEKRDNRITVIHKQNGGLSSARNAGLRKANGSYIMFIDSDDYISKDMVQILYDKLRKSDADIAICGFKEVYEGEAECILENNKEVESFVFEKEDIISNLFNENSLSTVVAWNKLYKKELFSNTFYPEGKLHEDEYMINELLFKCKKVVYINKELYYYLQRESSIMGSGYNLKRLEGLKAIEERYLLCKQYKVCEEKALVKMLDSMIENYLNVHKYYNSEKVILGDLKEKIHNYSKEGNNFRFKTKMKYKIFCFSPSMYKILVKILYE